MAEPLFELVEAPNGTLTLRRPGEEDVPDVRLRRAFPWSRQDELISVRSDKGKEIVLIERLADLSAQQRALVEKWLASNSFIPVVTRIESVNTDFGYQQWSVQTDRGPIQFRVQEREDIRFLPDGRFSLKDVDGNIYALPPIQTLDHASRKALEGVL